MVALLGIRDTAPGKKGSPQERRPVAGLLHHTEIDVEHQILLGIEPQQVDDMVQLFLIRDLEDPLPSSCSGSGWRSNCRLKARRNSLGSRAAKWGFSVMMRTSVALKVLQNSKIP